jgi:hypothetical protein
MQNYLGPIIWQYIKKIYHRNYLSPLHSKWHILFFMICNNRLTLTCNIHIIKCFCVTWKTKCVILNVTDSFAKLLEFFIVSCKQNLTFVQLAILYKSQLAKCWIEEIWELLLKILFQNKIIRKWRIYYIVYLY